LPFWSGEGVVDTAACYSGHSQKQL